MPATTRKGYNSPMSDSHRDKIAKSNILNRLVRHAEGLEDMKQTEVNAGLALLKKVLPDLQPIDPNTGQGGLSIRIFNDVLE